MCGVTYHDRVELLQDIVCVVSITHAVGRCLGGGDQDGRRRQGGKE
jgi:hypothetical protein